MIKELKDLKKKILFKNAWEKVAESLDLAEKGNFIRASSSNWEYFEGTCSEKKNGALFCVWNSCKILANQFDFRRCYFGIQ